MGEWSFAVLRSGGNRSDAFNARQAVIGWGMLAVALTQRAHISGGALIAAEQPPVIESETVAVAPFLERLASVRPRPKLRAVILTARVARRPVHRDFLD